MRTRCLLPLLGVPSLLLHASPAAGAAAEDDVTALTETQFLDKVAAADPRPLVLDALVDQADAGVTQAGLLPNPTLSYDREEVTVSGDGLPDTFLRVAWPVDLSGRRSRRIDAAEAGAAAVRAETSLDRFLYTASALAVFHDAAYARLRVVTLREGREALAAIVEVERSRAAAGDIAGYDLGRLQIELADVDDLVAEADIELRAAQRAVARLVGDPEGRVDAFDALDLPALPPAPGAEVLEERGDYRGARKRADQAGHEIAAARRWWLPTIDLSGGLKTSEIAGGDATGYVLGIAVAIPLFDHGQADLAAARARKKQALAGARILEWEIPSLARAAHETLALRIAQAERYSDAQVAKLADLLRRAEAIYREGDRPIIELLDAHRTARQVRLRYLELRHEAKRAELDLWRALGRRP